MAGFRALSPNITVATESGQLRTELRNTFARLDGQLQLAPYRVGTVIGPVGNDAGAETTLGSLTITQGTLAKTGSSLLIFAAGKTATNANNKTLKLKFGSTTFFDSGAIAMNDDDWVLEAELVMTGSANQTFWGILNRDGATAEDVNVTTGTVDLSSNQALTITGNGTAASDISLYYMKVLLIT